MTKVVIDDSIKKELKEYLGSNQSAGLVNTYLFYIEKKFNLQPVLYVKEKKIYQSAPQLLAKLEKEGTLWHETEIKISFSGHSVNEKTRKVYICPFSGKVFGDNTHPNPQDAIYDWVSKCPENTERVGGLRVKRFFVSEDPEVIQSYISKQKPKEPIVKKVFSSALSGRLFSTKEAVVKDFKKNYLKQMSLIEVQGQNRFEIEDQFLDFLQEQLVEDKLASFVEAMAEEDEFESFVERWVEME